MAPEFVSAMQHGKWGGGRTRVVMYTIEGIVTAVIPWSCAFPERVALFCPSTELGLVNICLYDCGNDGRVADPRMSRCAIGIGHLAYLHKNFAS